MIKKIALSLICLFMVSSLGCRSYDSRVDIGYFFKTAPEKAAIDFLHALHNRDPGYIYDNFLPNKDKNRISRQRFLEEFLGLLEDVDQIDIHSTVYLGYEGDLSKVVVEFDVIYTNGGISEYKKYIYLLEENNKWKIIFEKTFI